MMSSHTSTLEALTENKSRLVMNELLSLVAGTGNAAQTLLTGKRGSVTWKSTRTAQSHPANP